MLNVTQSDIAESLLHIKQDRHFRAALLDAQMRSLAYAMFEVTLPSPVCEYTISIQPVAAS